MQRQKLAQISKKDGNSILKCCTIERPTFKVSWKIFPIYNNLFAGRLS